MDMLSPTRPHTDNHDEDCIIEKKKGAVLEVKTHGDESEYYNLACKYMIYFIMFDALFMILMILAALLAIIFNVAWLQLN